MLHIDENVQALIAHTTALVRAKSRAAALRAGGGQELTPPARGAALAAIIENATPHAEQVAAAYVRNAEVMASVAAQAPVTRRHVAETQAPMARALVTNVPLAIDAMNNLALDALELQAADTGGGPPVGPLLAGALAHMIAVGHGLQWTLPTTAAEARDRRHAHEACPMGSNVERPDECHLSDGERADRRGEVRTALLHVSREFKKACVPEAEKLNQLLADSAAAEEFLFSTLVSTLTGAAKAAVPLDFVTTQFLDHLKAARGAQLKGQGDARLRDSASALAALEEAVDQALDGAGDALLKFDDDQLQTLVLILQQLTAEKFAPSVRNFVERYRAQVAPLGHDDKLESYPTSNPTLGMAEAVWIKLDATNKRLARVIHVERDIGDGFARLQTHHHYRFRTWIDDDLQGAARADAAPTVDATEIEDVPLNQIMAGHR